MYPVYSSETMNGDLVIETDARGGYPVTGGARVVEVVQI
jgi:hypothetical protein